jgi:hypothetical protein
MEISHPANFSNHLIVDAYHDESMCAIVFYKVINVDENETNFFFGDQSGSAHKIVQENYLAGM